MATIIDGNNFLGFAFPGQIRDPENRLTLVRKLLAYCHFTRSRIILVFDGRVAEEIFTLTRGEPKFRVVHPAEDESADSVIVDLIDKQKDRSRLRIVSNDRAIRDYAREAGAESLACKEFAGELKRTLGERKTLKEMDKPAARPSSLEVGLWMHVFQDEKKGRR